MSDNEINQQAGTPTGDVAVIGDETRDGQVVSMQLIQDIYNEFTGKTEEVSQGYSKSFQISLSDIEQLNSKITQIQEQYSICSKSCSVTIYYYQDTREVFSTFERFRMYDSSRLSPIESVLLKYNFLIKLPQTNRLQNYTLSIRLASRITILKKMREDLPTGLPLRHFIVDRTASVSIDYVDYMVARNFQDAVRGWIDGLEEHDTSKFTKFLQKRSHFIPRITKYAIGGVVVYLILKYITFFLPAGLVELNQLARFLILAFSTLFFSFRLADWLGTVSENAVDNFTELSYINLNRGDEKEIKIAKKKNQHYVLKAISGIGATLLLGILSSVIA